MSNNQNEQNQTPFWDFLANVNEDNSQNFGGHPFAAAYRPMSEQVAQPSRRKDGNNARAAKPSWGRPWGAARRRRFQQMQQDENGFTSDEEKTPLTPESSDDEKQNASAPPSYAALKEMAPIPEQEEHADHQKGPKKRGGRFAGRGGLGQGRGRGGNRGGRVGKNGPGPMKRRAIAEANGEGFIPRRFGPAGMRGPRGMGRMHGLGPHAGQRYPLRSGCPACQAHYQMMMNENNQGAAGLRKGRAGRVGPMGPRRRLAMQNRLAAQAAVNNETGIVTPFAPEQVKPKKAGKGKGLKKQARFNAEAANARDINENVTEPVKGNHGMKKGKKAAKATDSGIYESVPQTETVQSPTPEARAQRKAERQAMRVQRQAQRDTNKAARDGARAERSEAKAQRKAERQANKAQVKAEREAVKDGVKGLSSDIEKLELDPMAPKPKKQNIKRDFTPTVHRLNTPAAYVLHFSLPGANTSDIKVNYNAERSVVRVQGEIPRPTELANDEKSTVKLEGKNFGVFFRRAKIGTAKRPARVYPHGITSKLGNGVLRVEIPKMDRDEDDYVDVKAEKGKKMYPVKVE